MSKPTPHVVSSQRILVQQPQQHETNNDNDHFEPCPSGPHGPGRLHAAGESSECNFLPETQHDRRLGHFFRLFIYLYSLR